MKTKNFLSIAALIALSIFAASCSTDEPATEPVEEEKKYTTFSGTAGSTDATTSLSATRATLGEQGVSADNLTRSSMQRDALKAAGNFFWEKGDYVWVKDDNKKWYKSANTVTDHTSGFDFKAEGSYTNDGYTLHYTGTKSGSAEKVIISTTQIQSEFNNTAHFGESGDCAVATTKGGAFALEHKVTYLCFLPYVFDATKACKIKTITVTSDKNIAGEYTLSATGLTATSPTTTITLNAGTDGLEVTNTQKDITKSLYMVIAPETHRLTVKYVISDTNTNKEDTITKTYASAPLAANMTYELPVMLTSTSEQVFAYTSPLMTTWDEASKELDDLHNANIISWYVDYGDAHWDADQKWTLDGTEYTGGIWLKRTGVIASEQNITVDYMKQKGADAGRNDWHYFQEAAYNRYPNKKGKPDNLSDYFFLPALGGYFRESSKGEIGKVGSYWSKTPRINDDSRGWALTFDEWNISIAQMPKTFNLVGYNNFFK